MKPSQIVSWATDATVATGPEAGQPPILEPSSGFKAQGWVAEEESPARYMNWVLGLLGEWTAYLDNLHAETDFTGQDFVWDGSHTFNGPIEINDVADFTVPPTFPAGFTAAGFVAAPSNIGLGGVNNEVVYTDTLGADAPRPRTVMYPLGLIEVHGSVNTPPSLVRTPPNYYWMSNATGTVWVASLSVLLLPRGCELTGVRVGMYNASGGTLTFDADVVVSQPDKTTPSDSICVLIDSASASAATLTNHVLDIDFAGVPLAVDNSTKELLVRVSGGGAQAQLHWIEVTYNDPGPRNG